MIKLDNIQVIFGKGTPLQKQALNGVRLTIEEGTFVTVIGSNGAGKSTVLGVLAGDVIPTAGTVTIGSPSRLSGTGAGRYWMLNPMPRATSERMSSKSAVRWAIRGLSPSRRSCVSVD